MWRKILCRGAGFVQMKPLPILDCFLRQIVTDGGSYRSCRCKGYPGGSERNRRCSRISRHRRVARQLRQIDRVQSRAQPVRETARKRVEIMRFRKLEAAECEERLEILFSSLLRVKAYGVGGCPGAQLQQMGSGKQVVPGFVYP